MAKRVVLAYSGGLDTSVAVRWMIDNLGVEVIALAVDVGQAAEDYEVVKERARAAGAIEAIVVDAKEEYAAEYCAPALQANALYENRYPLVSALSRPVIVKHLVAAAKAPRRRRRRPRLHRQGQRPGALRGVHPRPQPGPRGHRAGAVVGDDPRGQHPLRLRPRHPDRGDEGEGVLDRRQHLGPSDRVRRDGGSRGTRRRPACGSSPSRPPPSHGDVVVGFEAGVPVSLDGEALSVLGVVQKLNDVVGLLRLGSARHGREPAGRHQEPRDLRVPGEPGPDPRPPRPRGHLPRARPAAGEGSARAALRRAHLRRAVVQPAQAGARRLHRREPALRHRRGAAAPLARLVRGRRVGAARTASTTTAWPPTTPRTASATRTPPASCACGASPWRPGPAPRVTCTGHEHPLARAVRGRPGRRAARLHGEPALRPAPRGRRHRRVAGPRPWPRARRRPHRGRARRGARRARPGRARAGRRDVRVRARPTRTSTPPSSGGSPSWPAPPAPSSTPAAAATTRSPPTCGSTRSGRCSRSPTGC